MRPYKCIPEDFNISSIQIENVLMLVVVPVGFVYKPRAEVTCRYW